MTATSIGGWIKELRGGLSQAALGEKLGKNGTAVTSETIWRWENGKNVPPDWRLKQLLVAFAVPEGPLHAYVYDLARQARLAAHDVKVGENAETKAIDVVTSHG